jgi:hypothetical protein
MDKERVWDAVEFYFSALETAARELMGIGNK